MFRKHARDLVVGLIALAMFLQVVAVPLYKLLRNFGIGPHGSLREDPDFYYLLIAFSLIHLGRSVGILFSLLGIACAFGSELGFTVDAARRQRARLWFWYLPAMWFCVEILGQYQVQRWFADRGVLFPVSWFVREAGPDLWWLLAGWVLTAPAILTGRGLYQRRAPAAVAPSLHAPPS